MSKEGFIALEIDNLNKMRNPVEPIGFLNWIKKNLDLYDEDDEVPITHIRTFLNYILEEVKSSRSKIDEQNKSLWIKKIKRLRRGLEVLEE
jgi:hypothetical protein